MKLQTVRAIAFLLGMLTLISCALVGCRGGADNPGETETKPRGYTDGTDDGNGGAEPSTLIVYPEFDERIERDYLYTVSVTQGDKTATLPVYNHTMASRTTRSPLDTSADEYRRFSTFAFDANGGGVRVDIRVNTDFESYSVIPSAKKFRNEFYKGVISVYLDKPDYFMIRLNDKDSTLLAVFADEPESEIPVKGANTIVVDGWREEEGGVLELNQKGTTLYIKPGAVLNARIRITADDCRVIGRGAIVDPFGDIYHYDKKDLSDVSGMLYIRNANNVKVDGVHLLNSRGFNIFVQGIWGRTYAKNNRITNAKLLSSQMTSDGLSFNYYNRNTLAEHCFVYCGDNALVYEDEVHYKDILVGTTCNALYPQTDVRNSSLENIYVFRADENIINCEMNGSDNQTLIDNSTVTNLYASDVTYTRSFLTIENVKNAVPANGGFTLKNVYLPDIDGIRTVFYQNLATGNYRVNLVNVSVDGVPVSSIAPTRNTYAGNYAGYVFPDRNWGWIGYPDTHEFTYSTTDDFKTETKRHKSVVNYQNDLNVLIGAWQVFYAAPVLREGSDILLPFEQTQRELRTGKTAETVERNGIPYVSASSLVSSGMAKKVATDGNRLILTPNDTDGNLLLPDAGILSQFTEIRPGHMELTAKQENGATVIHVTANAGKTDVTGIHCLLNEAVKKYGAGTYRVTFKAKSDQSVPLTVTIGYGLETVTLKSGSVTVGTEWTAGSLDFSVAANLLEQPQIRLTITGAWAKDLAFDLTGICLVKLN